MRCRAEMQRRDAERGKQIILSMSYRNKKEIGARTMQDFTNIRISIDRILFMSGLEKKNVSATINNNFLIVDGKEKDTQTWISLNTVFKMENVKILESE